jgi:hypothetical protein
MAAHIETRNTPVRFQIVADAGVWLVREASCSYSFSFVPGDFSYEFDRKSVAQDQIRRLEKWQAKGNQIRLHLIDTPDAFEAVADTKYGCEW